MKSRIVLSGGGGGVGGCVVGSAVVFCHLANKTQA